MINEYTQPIASLYILSIILLFLCTCSGSLLCSCWQNPPILRHLSSAQHLSLTFGEKIPPAHFALPHWNEPPTCLFLSSYLCSVYAVFWHQNTHRWISRSGKYQTVRPCCLSWVLCCDKNRALQVFGLNIGHLVPRMVLWKDNWGIKMERVCPLGNGYAYMVILHINGL